MFGRTGFGRRSNGRDGEPDINLIPVMNVFVTIIPFLLLGVSFYKVAGIAGSVPTASGDGTSDVASATDAVTVTLTVSAERGYAIRASGLGVTPEALMALSGQVPLRDGKLDPAALSEALLAIKDRYPASDTVVVVPDPGVLFEDLVRTMDAAREVALADTTASAAVGADADAKQPVRAEALPRVTLFPRVVMAGRSGPAPAASAPDAPGAPGTIDGPAPATATPSATKTEEG